MNLIQFSYRQYIGIIQLMYLGFDIYILSRTKVTQDQTTNPLITKIKDFKIQAVEIYRIKVYFIYEDVSHESFSE